MFVEMSVKQAKFDMIKAVANKGMEKFLNNKLQKQQTHTHSSKIFLKTLVASVRSG